jgi:hypothetical protein
MAGEVLETDSMQQTEDETRKAWASRMMDGGCHLDSAASRDAVHERDACRNSPAPARTTTPRRHSRTCTGTGTGAGLFSSLVFRDGSASTEARAWRGWQPMDGPVHGETAQISSSLHAKWA